MMVIAGEIIILASALCSCTAGITGGLAQGALGSLIVVYGAGGWMVWRLACRFVVAIKLRDFA